MIDCTWCRLIELNGSVPVRSRVRSSGHFTAVSEPSDDLRVFSLITAKSSWFQSSYRATLELFPSNDVRSSHHFRSVSEQLRSHFGSVFQVVMCLPVATLGQFQSSETETPSTKFIRFQSNSSSIYERLRIS